MVWTTPRVRGPIPVPPGLECIRHVVPLLGGRVNAAEGGRAGRPRDRRRPPGRAGRPSASRTASRSTLRLTMARAIGPELVVARGAADEPDGATVEQQVGAGARQPVGGAVEVQHRQPPRRPAEGVHAGDGLLAAVAALVEVDGGADPPGFVGDRAVVGVDAEPRLAPGDAQGLEGPQCRTAARPPGRRPPAGRGAPGRTPSHGSVSADRSPGDGDVVGDDRDLDAHHEAHPVEELHQCCAPAGFGVGGERLAVVDAGEGVLDVALGAQDQRLGPLALGEVEEVLSGQRVQPRQPVGPADPHDVAMGEVDEPVVRLERALLAGEGAVVRGDAARRSRRRRRRRGGRAAGWSRGLRRLCRRGHSTHSPNTVRWPTSTTKPCSARSRSARGCSMSGSTETTR